MVNCLLCAVLSSAPDVPFRRLFTVFEVDSEVLFETDRFAIIADVAPVLEGHLLAISKRHVTASAQLGESALAELADVVALAEQVLGGTYGPCCVFEHGSGMGATDAACIEHAHVHIVPHGGDLRQHSVYRDAFVRIEDWLSLTAIPAGIGYLFSRSSSHEYWLAVRHSVERQHWRRTLASAYSLEFPDWRLMGETSGGRELARQRIFNVREVLAQLSESRIRGSS